jgi:hypothetical protein
VIFRVVLGGFLRMVGSVVEMPLRNVGMMTGGGMFALFVTLRGFQVMLRGFVVMLSSLAVMFGAFVFGHGSFSLRRMPEAYMPEGKSGVTVVGMRG